MTSFSIITPVLNMADHIGACIESVATQSVDKELLIMDGGSTDGTLEVIRSHNYPWLKLISEKDEGQSSAINKGLRMATGEFFNWLNADDVLSENALKAVGSKMSPSVDVILGKCNHVNMDTDEVVATGRTNVYSTTEKTLANFSMAQPSHFYRTEKVLALGGLNNGLNLTMDMDLWFRYVLKNGISKVVTIDTVLSNFNLHGRSKTTTLASEMSKEKYSVFLALLNSISAPKWLKEHVRTKASTHTLEYNVGGFDSTQFLSEFAFHLMQESYEVGDLKTAGSLFDLVKQGNRLNEGELFEWRIRTKGTSGRIIRKLRQR